LRSDRGASSSTTAGKIFLGIEFVPMVDKAALSNFITTASGSTIDDTQQRMLYAQVLQVRGLKSGQFFGKQDPAVQVEVLGTGVKGSCKPKIDGSTDCSWDNHDGDITLGYTDTGSSSGQASAAIAIRVYNAQKWSVSSDKYIGQCNWLLSDDVLQGKCATVWHTLWSGKDKCGEVLVKCRVGCGGETVDTITTTTDTHSSAIGSSVSAAGCDVDAAINSLSKGKYHIECVSLSSAVTNDSSTEIVAFMTNAITETAAVAPAAAVPQARKLAAAATSSSASADASKTFVVSDSGNAAAVLCMQLQRSGVPYAHVHLTADQLVAARNAAGTDCRHELTWTNATATTTAATSGTVVLCVRYIPLAVGVISIAVQEAVFSTTNKNSADTDASYVRAQTILTPAAIGSTQLRARKSKRTRVTLSKQQQQPQVKAVWSGVAAHIMQYSNATVSEAASLSIALQSATAANNDSSCNDATVLGRTCIAVDAVVTQAVAAVIKEIAVKERAAHTRNCIPPIGTLAADYSHSIDDTWYPLTAAASNDVIGRVRVAISFAPHPYILSDDSSSSGVTGTAVGSHSTLQSTGATQMKALFYKLDRNGNGNVDMNELLDALTEACETVECDTDNNGTNDAVDIRGIKNGTSKAAKAGKFLLQAADILQIGSSGMSTADRVAAIFKHMDTDSSGQLSYKEYIAFVHAATAVQTASHIAGLTADLVHDNSDESDDIIAGAEAVKPVRKVSGVAVIAALQGQLDQSGSPCTTPTNTATAAVVSEVPTLPVVDAKAAAAAAAQKQSKPVVKEVATAAVKAPRRVSVAAAAVPAVVPPAKLIPMSADIKRWKCEHVQQWLQQDMQLPQVSSFLILHLSNRARILMTNSITCKTALLCTAVCTKHPLNM
jgi:Ca2+-binding EF-hand superfamily protein